MVVNNNIVRTRMAPSPTGELHIGTLRTLLYNYAFAKKNHGQFIIRIEDTDQKRLVEGSADRLLKNIKEYGLSWDEGPEVGGECGPYVQTQRLNIYQQHIKTLLDKGNAYYCFCTEERLESLRQTQKVAKRIPKYDKFCLHLTPDEVKEKINLGIPYVIRMKMPENETVVFEDLIRGQIKFNTNDLDDQVLIKSNGIPTYHFAVVVDDHLMKISHIFRAEEWISSTPKHVLLYKYFGWEVPKIAHLTVLLDPSHPGKMSKRHGSVFSQQFLDEGYIPEAMLNFLMLLGWNPGTDRELFTLDEFVEEFSLEHLHKKAAIFDRKKLDYLNGLYIRKLDDTKLSYYFKKFINQASEQQIKLLIPILKERLIKFGDLPQTVKFLFEDIEYSTDLILKKGTPPEDAISMLTQTKELLTTTNKLDFDIIQPKILELISKNYWKMGDYFMVLRVAICGTAFTPPIVECLPILGKENIIRKLNLALSKLI